jgi:cysteine desulfurase
MRAGTENIAGIVGLGKAMQLAYQELEEDRAHISGLKNYMKKKLMDICPGITFNGHPEHSLYTVLNASFPPGPYTDLMIMSLDIAGISTSGGSACSSGAESQSHVLEAIHHPEDRKAVRFSFSKYTTREDIDYTIEQLHGILVDGVPEMT